MSFRFRFFLTAALFLLWTTGRGQSYFIRATGSSNVEMYVSAVNNKGEAVGQYYSNGSEYWSGGWIYLPEAAYGLPAGTSFIPPPVNTNSLDGEAMNFIDINDSGQVLVQYLPGTGDVDGVRLLVWQNGSFKELLRGNYATNGAVYIENIIQNVINNNGLIGGSLLICLRTNAAFQCSPKQRAFTQSANGGKYRLLTGNPTATILAGNSSDQFVGIHTPTTNNIRGALWDHGQLRDFASLVGSSSNLYPKKINDLGQVVGVGTNGYPLFLYTPFPFAQYTNRFSTITTSSFPASVVAFNKRGNMIYTVGTSMWYWNGGAPFNFTNYTFAGWEGIAPVDMNDEGRIVGDGIFNGVQRPFFMSPLMQLKIEPSTNRVRAGQNFTVRLTCTSFLSNDLQNTFPLINPLRLDGTGGAEFVSTNPVPATLQTLPAFSNLVFTYTLKATNAGAILFTGQVRGSNAIYGRITSPKITSDPLLVADLADLLVKLEDESNASYKGDDIYLDEPGSPQKRKVEAAAGSPINFNLRVQNDSLTNRAFALRLTETTNEGWQVSYFLNGTNNISTTLRSGTYMTAILATGAVETITARMLSETNAEVGSDWTSQIGVYDKTNDYFTLDVAEVIGVVAGEIIVNVDGDEEDADPDDGVIDVNLAKAGPQVTLRAAINYANSGERPGFDIIKFAIEDDPGPGLLNFSGTIHKIAVQAPLPGITGALKIDGFSQLGGLINIDGALAGVADGLRLLTTNSTIQGLMITRFQGAGISIVGGKEHEISGNVIGTNPDGDSGLGNTDGIRVTGGGLFKIGGITATLRNVISGNSSNGLSMVLSSNISVLGNLFGTDSSGAVSRPNGGIGMLIHNVSQLTVGASNIVSIYNSPIGLLLTNITGANNRIFNCNFGLNADGTAPLGGTQTGARLADCANVVFGGTGSSELNVFSGITSNALEILHSSATKLNENYFGTDRSGNSSVGANGVNIQLKDDQNTTLGDTNAPVVMSGGLFGGLRAVSSLNPTLNHVFAGVARNGLSPLTGVNRILAQSTTNLQIGPLGTTTANLLSSLTASRVVVANSTTNAIELNNTVNTGLRSLIIGMGANGISAMTNAGFAIAMTDDVNTQIGDSNAPVVMGNSSMGGVSATRSSGSSFSHLLSGIALNGTTAMPNGGPGLIGKFTSGLVLGPLGSLNTNLQSGARVVVANSLSNLVELIGSQNTSIQNVLLGTDISGLIGQTNKGFALFTDSDINTTIGNTNAPVVMSSSGRGGMFSLRSVSSVINFALIGTGPDGQTKLPMLGSGIVAMLATNMTIGTSSGSLSNLISGVLIGNSQSNGVELISTKDARILAAMFGTDATGMSARTNGGFNIFLQQDSGTQIGDSNAPVVLASGKRGGLFSSGSLGTTIKRVVAGVGLNGLLQLPNGGPNLSIFSSTNFTIGGSNLLEQCVLGMSPTNSVEVFGSIGTLVQNCRIGTDATGLIPLPNKGNGIVVASNSANVKIGSSGGLFGGVIRNIVRNSGVSGIAGFGAITNLAIQNTLIFTNGLKAILRELPGLSAPVISNSFRGSAHVEGSVAGKPNDTVTLEFYAYRPVGASQGEGEKFIGKTTVTLNASGFGTYNLLFSSTPPQNWRVASTVTDSTYGTSEYSLGNAPAPAPDSDGDGMPDYWEALHANAGLNPNVFNSPTADFDHDGFSNLQEYLANTDPADPNSYFHIDRVIAGNPTQILFTAADGRQYVLLRSSDLLGWTKVLTNAPDLGGPITLKDSSPAPGKAFYRLIVEFP